MKNKEQGYFKITIETGWGIHEKRSLENYPEKFICRYIIRIQFLHPD